MTQRRLVLASASPRRARLLKEAGFDFIVRPTAVDESVATGEDPMTYVERLAREKATAEIAEGELVLAADTTVVLAGEILGKPTGKSDAIHMLERLAGRKHTVLTGVALATARPERAVEVESLVVATEVRLAPLSRDEIESYVATGEPFDKAGGYAIQGMGALFVESIDGNYSNVVGLPLPAVRALLETAGRNPLSARFGKLGEPDRLA